MALGNVYVSSRFQKMIIVCGSRQQLINVMPSKLSLLTDIYVITNYFGRGH